MPAIPPAGPSYTPEKSAIPSLPDKLKVLIDKPVWGLFKKNPEGSAKKYTVNCRANDPNTLRDLHTVMKYLTVDHVVVLSVQLAQNHLPGHLHFWDIDRYHSSAFDSAIYNMLVQNTYTDRSPSGNGAHAFFLTPKNKLYVPRFTEGDRLPEGYEIHNTGFATFTFETLSTTTDILTVTNELHLKNKKVPLQDKNPMSPFLPNKQLSPVWCYNVQTDVPTLLEELGYTNRGRKWLAPTSESGNPGVYVNESLRGPWSGTFSLHDSDPLRGRWLDPYGILTAYKKVSIAELAKTTNAVDPATGEILDATVHEYNNNIQKLKFDVKPAEPIALMMERYKETISTPIDSFYTCTVFSHLSLFMQNTVKMPMMGMRGTNTLFMMLAYSAAGKDNNVSVPTQGIGRILAPLAQQHGIPLVAELLEGMVKRMPKVTVLSALLQELTNEESRRGRVWMDTDCKDLLGKFQGGGNSIGVSGLTDAIIEIADGIRITGMTKAQEDLAGFDEAIPVLLASQTDVALELFTEDLMARGFFGRFDFILHKDAEKTEIINPFVKGNVKPFAITDTTLLNWLLYCLKHAADLRSNELTKFVVAELTEDARHALEKWFEKYVSTPSSEWTEDRKKFISRVSMSIEKMATIDAWADHMWGCFHAQNKEPYKTQIVINTINVERYFSYAEYQVNVRNGEVLNLIKAKPKSVDTKNEQLVLAKIKECLKNPKLMQTTFKKLNVEYIKSHGVIGRAVLAQMTNINAKTLAPLLAAMDGGSIVFHKKGEVLVNGAGVPLTLSRGDFVALS